VSAVTWYRPMGYRGESVVPFEEMPRTRCERAEAVLATPAMKASGWFQGLLMQERRDRQRAQRKPGPPAPKSVVPLDRHRDPSERLLSAWAPVGQAVEQALGENSPAFAMYGFHPHGLVAGVWHVACRPQTVGWVQARFGSFLAACAGRPVVIVACDQYERAA
jgi:hypothetical protein